MTMNPIDTEALEAIALLRKHLNRTTNVTSSWKLGVEYALTYIEDRIMARHYEEHMNQLDEDLKEEHRFQRQEPY